MNKATILKLSVMTVLFTALQLSFSVKAYSSGQPDLSAIEIVQAKPESSSQQKTKQVSAYGTFAIVEAPINASKWLLDQLVGGIGRVGGFVVDGVLYPAKRLSRNNQNHAAR